MIRIVLGGSYRVKDKVSKFVKFCPEKWKTDSVINVMSRVSSLKGSLLFTKSSLHFNKAVLSLQIPCSHINLVLAHNLSAKLSNHSQIS